MAFFPRPVGPAAAWADFRSFVSQRRPHQWVFAALAVALTTAVGLAFYVQYNVEPEWRQPEVTYITQWPADRSVDQIRAQQAIDLPKEQAAERKREEARLERQRQFQRLEKRLGL